jgi:hypothetical protein
MRRPHLEEGIEMDEVIGKLLPALKLGRARRAGALTLLPLFAEMPEGPDYVTLGEAIAAGTLVVGESTDGGVVGELAASNTGKAAVLIVSGEELSGAKQNRVLNTTVLVPAGGRMVLPVSCTEQGRWSYLSDSFRDSGYVASRRVRAVANETVTANVRAGGHYGSDQHRV